MQLLSERHVSVEDLRRYFRGCYVVDPFNGKPGYVSNFQSSTSAEIAYLDGSPSHTYARARSAYFTSLDSYILPVVEGWRNVRDSDGQYTAVLVYLSPASGGTRGITSERMKILYPGTLTIPLPGDATFSLATGELELDSIKDFGNLLFTLPNSTYKQALEDIKESVYTTGRAVSADVALLPYRNFAKNGETEVGVFYHSRLAARITSSGAVVVAKRLAPLIGDVHALTLPA